VSAPRIDGDDIWCLQMLLANNIDLPRPVVATALITGRPARVTFSLIVETGAEVDQWAAAMTDREHATCTPSYSGRDRLKVAADGWMDCPNHGPNRRGHTIKVAVTSRLRSFTSAGAGGAA